MRYLRNLWTNKEKYQADRRIEWKGQRDRKTKLNKRYVWEDKPIKQRTQGDILELRWYSGKVMW